MRVRQLDTSGDMTFGQGPLNFYVNSVDAVAQNIGTRLRLLTGEWFLDVSDGTDYAGSVLGYGTAETRDIEIRTRILETDGVTEIIDYSSAVDVNRRFSVSGRVNTIYGVTPFSSVQ